MWPTQLRTFSHTATNLSKGNVSEQVHCNHCQAFDLKKKWFPECMRIEWRFSQFQTFLRLSINLCVCVCDLRIFLFLGSMIYQCSAGCCCVWDDPHLSICHLSEQVEILLSIKLAWLNKPCSSWTRLPRESGTNRCHSHDNWVIRGSWGPGWLDVCPFREMDRLTTST